MSCGGGCACDSGGSGEGYPMWTSLQKYGLAKAAELLKCSKEDVQAMSFNAFPTTHFGTPYRDTLIMSVGAATGLPPVIGKARHAKGFPGVGIHLYRCRSQKNLHYVYWQNLGCGEYLFFVKKGEAAKIVRACYAQCKKATAKNEPPTLEGDIVDDVLNHSIRFLKSRKMMDKYGVKINRGLLLSGPPGNGKSMLCRYLQRCCYENGFSVSIVTTPEINAAYEKNNLAMIFNSADVTFFDDIDVSYLNRSAHDGKIACALLAAMDGMQNRGSFCVRVFTTNENITSLDDAFTRPGRIDRIITVPRPSTGVRRALVEMWNPEIVNAIDIEELVRASKGYSCTDLEAVKAFLVTNYFSGNGRWDLDGALALLKERGVTTEKHVSGFAPPSGKPMLMGDQGRGIDVPATPAAAKSK